MSLQLESFDLPAHWSAWLLYDDDSGLDDDDILAANGFLKWMVQEYGACRCVNIEIDESGDFRNYHDASCFGALACDIGVFTFDISKQ
jgi:hypothetical protein